MIEEEIKMIDEFEEVFVTNKLVYLDSVRKSEKFSDIIILSNLIVPALVINYIAFNFINKYNDIYGTIFLTLISNMITILPTMLLYFIYFFIAKSIWHKTKSYENCISVLKNAEIVKSKFIKLIETNFQIDKIKLIQENDFKDTIKKLYRITYLYYLTNEAVDGNYYKFCDKFQFLNFLTFSKEMNYEKFVSFLGYNNFLKEFNERLAYRKSEIRRRRVHHTRRFEIVLACEEIFKIKKYDEILNNFYSCFNEKEIEILNLEYVTTELTNLQNLRNENQNSYLPQSLDKKTNQITNKIDVTTKLEIQKNLEKLKYDIENISKPQSVEKSNEILIEPTEFKVPIKFEITLPNNHIIIDTPPGKDLSTTKNKKTKIKRKVKISNDALTQRLKNNNLIGELGENFIFENEKEKVGAIAKEGFEVIHSSKVIGDGLGYDIESFDNDYNKIFIEVKTTTGNENTDFFLSRNEMNKFQAKSNLHIYRLVNFNPNTNDGEIIKITSKEELARDYDIVPNKFLVKLKNL